MSRPDVKNQSDFDSVERLRYMYATQRLSREGVLFPFPSIKEFLTSQRQFVVPPEVLYDERKNPYKPGRVECVDDGIFPVDPNYNKFVIAISGSGAGVDSSVLRAVFSGYRAANIKYHQGCGKAGLVLSEIKQATPTAEEIDEFARTEAERIAREFGARYGRGIGFEQDGRRTLMKRPPDIHLGDGAIISMSDRGDFLENLLPAEVLPRLPATYRITGGHVVLGQDRKTQEKLRQFLTSEMVLTNMIASGPHGLGHLNRPFVYTALVNRNDRTAGWRINDLKTIFDTVKQRSLSGVLNWPQLHVVLYDTVDDNRGRVTNFWNGDPR